jgi:hypothetical protein
MLYYTRSSDINLTEERLSLSLSVSRAFKAWALVTSVAALRTLLIIKGLLAVRFRS